ncbi:MAG: SDR family oxidoreductase [Chloroflexota bacterium]
MHKHTVLVTGATDGIGRATAIGLAQKGLRVVIHGRSLPKAERASAEVAEAVPGAALETIAADLASLAQVRALADELGRRFPDLDVLVHNAGVFMNQRRLTEDGYETTFAVNHLAPFLLTNLLLDQLLPARARVVTVASISHTRGRINFADLHGSQAFTPYTAYAQSKLANVLFAQELARRTHGSGLTSNSLHPGAITTKLLQTGFNSTGDSVEQGAATSIHLASAPELDGVSGRYYSEMREIAPAAQANDLEAQQRLWEVSCQLTGLN